MCQGLRHHIEATTSNHHYDPTEKAELPHGGAATQRFKKKKKNHTNSITNT